MAEFSKCSGTLSVRIRTGRRSLYAITDPALHLAWDTGPRTKPWTPHWIPRGIPDSARCPGSRIESFGKLRIQCENPAPACNPASDSGPRTRSRTSRIGCRRGTLYIYGEGVIVPYCIPAHGDRSHIRLRRRGHRGQRGFQRRSCTKNISCLRYNPPPFFPMIEAPRSQDVS